MTPSRAKSEDEIADAIESWEREELENQEVGPKRIRPPRRLENDSAEVPTHRPNQGAY